MLSGRISFSCVAALLAPTLVAGISPQHPDPWPSGIPTLPKKCDPINMTEDCLKTLDARASTTGKGAYLYMDPKHIPSPSSRLLTETHPTLVTTPITCNGT